MNYPTKHQTKAIVQTQCYVALRSALSVGSEPLPHEALAKTGLSSCACFYCGCGNDT